MKIGRFVFALFSIVAFSCATFEKEELYGKWSSNNWDFVFEKDGTCKVGKKGQFLDGNWTYHTFGNTIEIAQDGTVFLSNLTIKSLLNNELKLEFRNIQGAEGVSTIEILKRI